MLTSLESMNGLVALRLRKLLRNMRARSLEREHIPFLAKRTYTTTNRSSSSNLIVIMVIVIICMPCTHTHTQWPCTAIEAKRLHLLRLCVFVYPQNG